MDNFRDAYPRFPDLEVRLTLFSSDVRYEIFYILPIMIIAHKIYHIYNFE